eukprot:scaffold2389_cov262-Pinguiococcus_pyrenoidosus.AAC.1
MRAASLLHEVRVAILRGAMKSDERAEPASEKGSQSTMTNATAPNFGSEITAENDTLAKLSGKENELAQIEAKQVQPGRENRGRWTEEEHQIFIEALEEYGKVRRRCLGCRSRPRLTSHPLRAPPAWRLRRTGES